MLGSLPGSLTEQPCWLVALSNCRWRHRLLSVVRPIIFTNISLLCIVCWILSAIAFIINHNFRDVYALRKYITLLLRTQLYAAPHFHTHRFNWSFINRLKPDLPSITNASYTSWVYNTTKYWGCKTEDTQLSGTGSERICSSRMLNQDQNVVRWQFRIDSRSVLEPL